MKLKERIKLSVLKNTNKKHTALFLGEYKLQPLGSKEVTWRQFFDRSIA